MDSNRTFIIINTYLETSDVLVNDNGGVAGAGVVRVDDECNEEVVD